MTGKTKICPFCQKEFYTEQNAQVYCCERCRRSMARRNRLLEKKTSVYICGYVLCGKEFISDRKTKYCCAECRQRANGKLVAKPKPKEKQNLSLAQINELARAAGMNYGQYVAKHGL